MSSFWPRAAGAALACAGAALADMGTFSNIKDFTALTNASHGFPHQTFRSSDIIAPIFQVNTYNEDEVDDAPYIFLGTVYGHMNAGPMILDARDLSLVYADQQYQNTYHSSVQMIGDTPYLTFWEGAHTRGHANGFPLIFDQEYNLKYNISAKGNNGALVDMHEFSFTDDGNVVFSAYSTIPYDVSAVGGPHNGFLLEGGFQEVDPETDELIFDWHASKHFKITDSYAEYSSAYGVKTNTSGWDFFHINSIQKTVDNNYLVSSRHLSMLTLINGTDGSPIWILGGKENQFEDLSDGEATNFGWQHDARFFHNQSHITMFDNHGESSGPCGEKCHTRGLHLEIDTDKMTARVVQEYFHPERVNSAAMGGFQALPNGNVLIGWGYNPSFVEYKSDGTPVLDVQRGIVGGPLVDGMFAYRVSKQHWKGTPSWEPEIAVESPEKTTRQGKVYVSWNGATEVASWVIFATDSPTEIDDPGNIIAESPRRGFETEISLGAAHSRRYVAAAAVDASGKVLSSSRVTDMQTGRPYIIGITSVGSEDSVADEKDVSGDDGDEDDEDSNFSTVSGSIGIMAGSLFVFAFLSYGGLRFWRKRRRATEEERGQYSKVDMEGA